MLKFCLINLLIVACVSTSFAQDKSIDRLQLNRLILDFQESIEGKDSIKFISLFFDSEVSFVGKMSVKTEMSIKKDYPEFEGLAVSTSSRFIREICAQEKKQKENFYNINIDSDGAIACISFDYSYFSGDKMIQWGNEKWNLVYVGNQWLITDVLYSIHFPDIEPFPYSSVNK